MWQQVGFSCNWTHQDTELQKIKDFHYHSDLQEIARAVLKDFEKPWISEYGSAFCADLNRRAGNKQVGSHPCFWLASFLDPRSKHLSISNWAGPFPTELILVQLKSMLWVWSLHKKKKLLQKLALLLQLYHKKQAQVLLLQQEWEVDSSVMCFPVLQKQYQLEVTEE